MFKKILVEVWRFIGVTLPYLISIIVGIISGYLAKDTQTGVIITTSLLGFYILFIFFRQLYWFIFSKGDYENKNKKG
jgi:hypothetical protein